MKRLKNSTTGNVAYVDIITEEKGILNVYTNDAAFWTSQVPIQSADKVPAESFDKMTNRALSDLGSDWTLIDT